MQQSNEQSQEALSDVIREEYYQSGCQRSDLEHAVKRLLTDCADVFAGEESAVEFLMDAEDEDD